MDTFCFLGKADLRTEYPNSICKFALERHRVMEKKKKMTVSIDAKKFYFSDTSFNCFDEKKRNLSRSFNFTSAYEAFILED